MGREYIRDMKDKYNQLEAESNMFRRAFAIRKRYRRDNSMLHFFKNVLQGTIRNKRHF